MAGDTQAAQPTRDWVGVKKKRGDCSPLSFSFERKQLPSVLPGVTRKKLAATSLARSLRFSSRCRVKREPNGSASPTTGPDLWRRRDAVPIELFRSRSILPCPA